MDHSYLAWVVRILSVVYLKRHQVGRDLEHLTHAMGAASNAFTRSLMVPLVRQNKATQHVVAAREATHLEATKALHAEMAARDAAHLHAIEAIHEEVRALRTEITGCDSRRSSPGDSVDGKCAMA
ncbi:hypothetical protein C8Q74DRAFT_1215853 [Fomes fomentarius]|nr:hypothetical protein C8Q74DRAFT_1215853 [Fomes fomentarius]